MSVVVALLAVLVAGAGKLTGEAEARNATRPVTNGFRLIEPSEGMVRGSLDRPDVMKNRFHGEIATQDGDRTSVTRVVAGSLVIDAKRNLRTRVVVAGGHGREITAAEKKTLRAVCQEFERSFGTLGAPMPPEEDLLVRSTCYYAEAPVGYQLTDKTIKVPSALSRKTPATVEDGESVNISYRQSQATDDVVDAPTPEECERAEASMVDFRTVLACQAEGESGIRYLECRDRNYNLYYDVRNPRLCYGFRGNVPTGPCTNNCIGRCGVKCGLPGKDGQYTRDCAEHDDCVADHDGPGVFGEDDNCGDEFGDADDDFFQARKNCIGCGNPN